jgi:hypothetical protein
VIFVCQHPSRRFTILQPTTVTTIPSSEIMVDRGANNVTSMPDIAPPPSSFVNIWRLGILAGGQTLDSACLRREHFSTKGFIPAPQATLQIFWSR